MPEPLTVVISPETQEMIADLYTSWSLRKLFAAVKAVSAHIDEARRQDKSHH